VPGSSTPSKRERTHARLQSVSLDLFERRGFDATTVAEIALAAGVTPMTFFRYFPSKAQALLEDPYDPVIAAAVAQQPMGLGPLNRVTAGVREAWSSLPEPTSDFQRRRIRVVAATPSLWGEMQATSIATEELIVDQLVADGTDRLDARAAAAAVLAALTAALLEWSRVDSISIRDAVDRALGVLEGSRG
jgi:AcrR family transcriptional regulator